MQADKRKRDALERFEQLCGGSCGAKDAEIALKAAGWAVDVAAKRRRDSSGRCCDTVPEVPADEGTLRAMLEWARNPQAPCEGAAVAPAFASWGHPYHSFYKWLEHRVGAAATTHKPDAAQRPEGTAAATTSQLPCVTQGGGSAETRSQPGTQAAGPVAGSSQPVTQAAGPAGGKAQQPSTQAAAAAGGGGGAKAPAGRARWARAAFAYDAIKTKVKSSSAQGPPDGSTWLWFIVADAVVKKAQPADGAAGAGATAQSQQYTARITGDKFQVGWCKGEPAPGMNKREDVKLRKADSIACMLSGKMSEYGKDRGGVPAGFQHHWTYSDSQWRVKNGRSHSTCKTTWDETRQEDRWSISVNMTWNVASNDTDDDPEGTYVIVASQFATKLNKNQYKTAMEGVQIKLPSNAGKDERREIMREEMHTFKPPVEKSLLGSWLVKKK